MATFRKPHELLRPAGKRKQALAESDRNRVVALAMHDQKRHCHLRHAPVGVKRIAQQQGITGEVWVRVSLDENSKIVSTSIDKTPSAVLNNAALQATRASTFKTRVVNCQPVADSYRFIVEFTSQ